MATTNIWDYSTTSASNTSVEGTNINTGMTPANVDNALRDILAMLRNSFGDQWEAILATTTLANARTQLGLGTAAVLDETTTAQFRANTADKALSTDQVWAAADYVALTDAATVAVDMSLGFNFSLAIGGNRTLGAPTNTKNGQSGLIAITQDGTGSRTLAYHANYKFAGAVDPVLSTAAGTVDLLFYQVISSTFIYATLVKAVA